MSLLTGLAGMGGAAGAGWIAAAEDMGLLGDDGSIMFSSNI
jgi:hypothetical protein